jgi:hypothetical protein
MLDMIRAGRRVYLVGAEGQPRERFEKLGLLALIPRENMTDKRTVALERAIYGRALQPEGTTDKTPDPGSDEAGSPGKEG